MVSSDFGKLEVRRHLISGDDWAMAGEATAATAAPVADTFKKSRRFIQSLLNSGVSRNFPRAYSTVQQIRCDRRRSGAHGLTRMSACGNATRAVTAPIKRKSNAVKSG